MEKRRVAVTGLGILCPLGSSLEEVFQTVKEQTCRIAPITHFDTADFRVKLAGEVKNLDEETYFSAKELRFNDRFTKFARIAAKQALRDAGLELESEDLSRAGVIFASGIGGIATIEECEQMLEKRGPGRVSPYFIPKALINLAAGSIALDYGLHGHCSSTVTACAASTDAIGEAFRRIQYGEEDIMLAGGSEASITPLAIAGFQSMRALHTGSDPERASIPFDVGRSGFVMGEGAGALVLEEWEHAQKRGAKIYGEIVGYGSSCDAHHVTSPEPEGRWAALAMEKALQDADLDPERIGYICAHGTSTKLNDQTESRAIGQVFGKHPVAVSSLKGAMGHLLGASGAVESIITIKALQEGLLLPTIGLQEQDPACQVQVVRQLRPAADLEYALKNSLGFGGHNACLVFRAVKEETCA